MSDLIERLRSPWTRFDGKREIICNEAADALATITAERNAALAELIVSKSIRAELADAVSAESLRSLTNARERNAALARVAVLEEALRYVRRETGMLGSYYGLGVRENTIALIEANIDLALAAPAQGDADAKG